MSEGNGMDLIALAFSLLAQIVVGVIIIAPILWLVGRALAGKEKARFTSAISIVVLGTVADALIGAVVGAYTGLLIVEIIMLIVWLALIKHFFDCGWLKTLAIAILALIIFIIIAFVLGMILLGMLGPAL